MEKGPVSIGQHEHPLFAQINLDAVNWLGPALSVLLTQNTHHLAFMFPRACHLRAAHIVRWQIIDHFRKPHLEGCEQLQQFCDSQHPIKDRVKNGENKTTLTVTNQHDAIAKLLELL